MENSSYDFDEKKWSSLKKDLKKIVGDTAYNNWLKKLGFLSLETNTITLSVPTKFLRDWIVNHYADKIKSHFKELSSNIEVLKIVVKPVGGRIVPGTARFVKDDNKKWSNNLDIRNNPIDNLSNNFGAPLDPRFTFENFVVGKPNELAFAAAQRIAEADIVSFNPLFLYGGVGLGKTHLMQGIAWRLRQRQPQRQVMYLSAEKFMYRFVRALRFKNIMGFKELFRSVDVLMIDDVQFMDGKDATQEEFFHTFNELVDKGHQIVVSGDRSPSDLDGMEERMRSRLGCGLVAEVHSTSYELRLGILQAKAESIVGSNVPDKVLEFLAHKITSNVRELEGALNRVVAHATLVGRPIALDSAQEVLHDLLRAHERRVTIEEIQKRVSDYYNIRVAEMSSARRAQMVARPRQVAMYLAKQLTSRSLPEIGRKFGNRDHTTVMHAIKKVDQLSQSDPSFAEDVELLRRMLES